MTTRREFLQKSAAIGGAMAVSLGALPAVHAAGSDRLRVGIVGCGGRGTGAAAQALAADKNCALTAMADLFEDRLRSCLSTLERKEELRGKLDVPPERQFVGFDACDKLIASGVDVVLLAAPPHFRPMHLKAAVDAGVHVFAEKPVAVDAPGVRSVLATCELAARKNLNVVSGLCLRYSFGFRETVRRVHDGAIGDVFHLEANDYRGPIWVKPREAGWTDMHWQTRNWYYFTWLSGDFNVEQHVHFLDVCSWVMKDEYPVKALGMGGRQVRTGEQFGNIFDHHSVVYEYANGAKLVANTRQMPGCKTKMGAVARGTKGLANISERDGDLRITGEQTWAYDGPANNFYQTEHDELFAAIRAGKTINNGEYMSKSTLLAIMGRMATYTGQEITWDMAMNSKEDLSPPKYEWGDLPTPPIAVPGVTKFV
jgi:predicted dehydrogenase